MSGLSRAHIRTTLEHLNKVSRPSVTSRRFIATGVLMSMIHLGVLCVCLVCAIGAGMERFDHPEIRESSLALATETTTEILMEPLLTITAIGWPNGGIPEWIEWPLFLLNSSLWGFSIALIVTVPWIWARRQRTNG